MFCPTLYNVTLSKLCSVQRCIMYRIVNSFQRCCLKRWTGLSTPYTHHTFIYLPCITINTTKGLSLSSTIMSTSLAWYIQWSLQNVQSSPVYKSSYRAANLLRRQIENLNVWWNILINIVVLWLVVVLYTNIDLKLRNKLHGPMHCKIGVTCVYNGHVFYTLLY